MARVILLLGSLLAAAAGEGWWPQWRGPNGLGVSAERNLPEHWSSTENVLWKTPIPGRGHSSPVVWGDRIFVTTSIEGPAVAGAKPVVHIRRGEKFVHPDSTGADRSYQLQLIAVARVRGRILWQRTAYQGTVLDDRHRKNTYASPTPVTDGTRVIAFFEAEGLYCYDVDGKLLWRTSLGKIAKMGMGPGTSPVLHQGLVIVQCDLEDGGPEAGSFVAALDAGTGREVWRTGRLHRKTHATPLLVQTRRGPQLIASGWESVVAYDPSTGRELWRADGLGGWGIPSPVGGHGLVFCSTGYPSKKTLAIRADPGEVAWRYDKGSAYVPSPILYGDYLYLMTDKGLITCLDARTGAVQYEGGRPPAAATFSASPVAYDGRLVISSEDGDMFVLRAGAKHEVLATCPMGEPIFASPAIAAGTMFVRTAANLFAVGRPSAAQ